MEDDSGRRHQRWWLIDESGKEHLAVTGEETVPRNRHYIYKAEAPFSQIRPLESRGQGKITSYLEGVCPCCQPKRLCSARCSIYLCVVPQLIF